MSTIKQQEQGFTLVELSIVLIIVGLLIGGILKGQELIANARIASTLQQIKAIDAGMNGFLDAYGYLPGDLPAPSLKLPDCAAAAICGLTDANGTGAQSNAAATLGDGVIGDKSVTNLGDAILADDVSRERAAAFVQLTAADFVGGIDPNAAQGGNLVFGVANPATTIPGGGYRIGFTRDGTGVNQTGADLDIRQGHYLEIANDPVAAIDDTTVSLTGSQAARIDRKLDDGLPNMGSVRANGVIGAGADACAVGDTDADIYLEANTQTVCGLYMRTAG